MRRGRSNVWWWQEDSRTKSSKSNASCLRIQWGTRRYSVVGWGLGGGGEAETPVRGYVLTRWAENHDSVIRNATRIHVMHSSLSSFFQEPGARCNNTEMALHQGLVHSHGHQVMYLFLSPLQKCADHFSSSLLTEESTWGRTERMYSTKRCGPLGIWIASSRQADER
jgi:hypothetical protein